MKDLSLKTLEVYYECQDNGSTNKYFESDMRDLANKYGLTVYTMEMTIGIREMVFRVEPKQKVNRGRTGERAT